MFGTPFGQTTTSSSNPFGTPSTTTNPFGGGGVTTPSATPFGGGSSAFGAPSTPSTSLFGNPSASSMTPFGAPATPSATTTSLGSNPFGTPSTSTNPFGTPSSTTASNPFGMTTSTPLAFGTQPSTTTPFGSQPSTTTPFGTTPFGQTSTTTPFGGGLMTTQQQPMAKPPPNPIQDLQTLADATKSFFHFFYNVRNPQEQVQTYPNDVFWNRAMADNPDPTTLVPVRICGFNGLEDRIKQQKKAIETTENVLQEAKKKIDELERQLEAQRDSLEEHRRVNVQLAQKTLGIMTKLEVLRSKGYPIHPDEDAFRGKLENLQRELSQPTQFKGRLNELNSLVRMQEELSPQISQPLEDDDLSNLFKYLSQQTEGVKLLVEVIKNDSQDIEVMLKEYQSENTS
eukprot:TRINITY_DN6308_c0_g1_i1.p1 TRINITY_DN6308_c0_g1~~TRINITY_DN6308_c0_g1_i1.p1  ORF type:complete len:399 (-),score=129.34 TRINITY_DN6308_c0_g1_i1:42-1238(-)